MFSMFSSEGLAEELVRDAAERKELIDEFSQEETTADPGVDRADIDNAEETGQRAELVAFRSAVNEARNDTEGQLALLIETMRKTAAEKHLGEVAQIADRHAKELRQTRETIEDEVTKRVRLEEPQRHAAEVAQIRGRPAECSGRCC